MSSNEKFLLDWILADVDIISFVLQQLLGVNNFMIETTFLINPKHMIVPHDSLYKLLKPLECRIYFIYLISFIITVCMYI